MKFIIHTRLKTTTISGSTNLPYGTEVESKGGYIYHNGKPLCRVSSQIAHDYLVSNEDGCGLQRAELIKSINTTLQKMDEEYQTRWDKIWADSVCQQYKRTDHADTWLWNDDFYTAPILNLTHIASLVQSK